MAKEAKYGACSSSGAAETHSGAMEAKHKAWKRILNPYGIILELWSVILVFGKGGHR